MNTREGCAVLNKEFDLFQKRYLEKFEYFYPAKNGTGFDETNLTVNFAAAYEQIHQAAGEICFTWYELQFGPKNNLHLDACILNISQKVMILVESKRLKSQDGQTQSVRDDIGRINTFDFVNEFSERLEDAAGYTVYGLILMDVWTENTGKSAVFDDLRSGTYQREALSGRQAQYYFREFCGLNSTIPKWMRLWTKSKSVETSNKENYKIAGISWLVHHN